MSYAVVPSVGTPSESVSDSDVFEDMDTCAVTRPFRPEAPLKTEELGFDELDKPSSEQVSDRDDPEHIPGETETAMMSEERPLAAAGVDEVDRAVSKQTPESKGQYTGCDILLHLFSVGSYLADVGTDIFLAYLYFCGGDWWWFGLTLAFILVPSLTITAFSLAWYYQEHAHNKENNVQIHNARWVSRLIFHILQIGPVIRYVDTMIYGCKSRPTTIKSEPKKEYWYELMLYESKDASMLRLIECFMEAAPQLVLQIYIMSRFGVKKSAVLFIGQMLSCMLSLCSLAWSLVAFRRAMQGGTSNQPKRCPCPNREWCSFMLRMVLRMVPQFCWHLFIIAARVLSLALFASRFTFWVGIVCVVHFIIMLAWLKPQSTNFCQGKQLQEFCFKVTMAGLYIFSDLDLPAGHTRLRYLFYYCIVYLENSFMILMWFFHTETTWYAVSAVVMVLVGFLIGVASQAIYYLYAHPNRNNIKLCLSRKELVGSCTGESPPEMI